MENNSIKRLLKAQGIGFLFIFAALLLAAGIFYLFSINENYISGILHFIVYSGSFFTGINSSKNAPDKGYKNGMLSGLVFGGVYTLISIFLNGADPINIIVKLSIILIISMFGGIIGINLKKKKR